MELEGNPTSPRAVCVGSKRTKRNKNTPKANHTYLLTLPAEERAGLLQVFLFPHKAMLQKSTTF